MLAVADQGNATTDPLFLYLTSHKFDFETWLGGTQENDDVMWQWITGEAIQGYAFLRASEEVHPGNCVLHYQGYIGNYNRFRANQIPALCSERLPYVCQFTVNSSEAKNDPKYHPAI
eukprot:scpid62410/ scgid10278/ 